MYAAAFSPWVMMRRMPMPSIAVSVSSSICGTKKMCVTPYPRSASATKRGPVVFGICTPPGNIRTGARPRRYLFQRAEICVRKMLTKHRIDFNTVRRRSTMRTTKVEWRAQGDLGKLPGAVLGGNVFSVPASHSTVDALLFDFGNIVIDIDFSRVFDAWAQAAGVPSAVIA